MWMYLSKVFSILLIYIEERNGLDINLEILQGIEYIVPLYFMFHTMGFVFHSVKYISRTVVFIFHSVKQRIGC